MWNPDLTELKDQHERVYETGRGAAAMAWRFLLPGLMLLALGLAVGTVLNPHVPPEKRLATVLPLLASVGPLFLALALGAAWHFLQERNARVLVSDACVTVVNWRRAQRFLPWDSLVGLEYWEGRGGRGPASGWLDAQTLDASGRQRRVRLARFWGSCPPEVMALAADIATRRGFSEVPKERSLFQRLIAALTQETVHVWR